MKIYIEGKKGRGRPKKRWQNTIENDTKATDVDDVEDRNKWRSRTRVAEPK